MKVFYPNPFRFSFLGKRCAPPNALGTLLVLVLALIGAVSAQAQNLIGYHYVDKVKYSYYDDNTALLLSVKDDDGKPVVSGHFVIPNTIDVEGKQYTVIGIHDNVFFDVKNLTGVTLPDGTKIIEETAFQWCSDLEKIENIPSHLDFIGEGAFKGTKFLDNSYVKGISTVADWIVSNNFASAPNKIVVPEGIYGIADRALYDNCSGSKIILPKSLRHVEGRSFQNPGEIIIKDNPKFTYQNGILYCDSSFTYSYQDCEAPAVETTSKGLFILDVYANAATEDGEVRIPAKADLNSEGKVISKPVVGVLETKRYHEFIKKLFLPEGFEYIERWSFYKMENLEHLDLPSTLKYLESSGISATSALTTVIYRAVEPVYFREPCLSFIQNATVYVPAESLEDYKTTKTNWKNAKEFRAIDDAVLQVEGVKQTANATVTAIYTPDGKKVSTMQRGINIVRYSDGTMRKVVR